MTALAELPEELQATVVAAEASMAGNPAANRTVMFSRLPRILVATAARYSPPAESNLN